MSTTTTHKPTLGAALDQMAQHGLENDGQTMHAASDWQVQSAHVTQLCIQNVRASVQRRADALAEQYANELMATSTAGNMVRLALATIVARGPRMESDKAIRAARIQVFDSFRRVLGMPE